MNMGSNLEENIKIRKYIRDCFRHNLEEMDIYLLGFPGSKKRIMQLYDKSVKQGLVNYADENNPSEGQL